MTVFFDEVLRLPEQVLLLEAQRKLEAMHPGRYVLHSRSDLFRHTRFVHEGRATLCTRQDHGAVIEHWPNEDTTKTYFDVVHRWDEVTWEGQSFGIAAVFTRARRASPCVLVLEDLDCLIDDSNRSVLLNELDGFAQNQGLLVVASTNHPEKLDRSLLDRPSRFDRKFHFPLPGADERGRFLQRWQLTVDGALKLTELGLARLVEGTHGFTFAYLKELTFGAMLAFMEDPAVGAMDEVAERVMVALKSEMSSARKMLPPLPDSERRISLS